MIALLILTGSLAAFVVANLFSNAEEESYNYRKYF